MSKHVRMLTTFALILTVALVAGCSASGSGEKESEAAKVWGYVASAEDAQLEVSETSDARDLLKVDRVLSPGAAWLVVHLEEDGKPSDRVGLLHVDAGESTNLEVPLAGVVGENVIVAVHADKGTPGRFDFNMMKKETSPDRPYFVDEKELAAVVALPGS